jgi:hypothetical protein
MQKSWNDYSKEILLINKSYFYFLKCYLKEKGFKEKDRDFTCNSNDIKICIDIFSAAIRIFFFDMQDDKAKDIWLHRYVLYPEVIDVGVFVKIPNPDWGYGFIEQMIQTLEGTLLNSLLNKDSIYYDILENHEIFYQNFLSKPPVIITGDAIRNEENKMLRIPFKATYLSLEMYKRRENPFKGNFKKLMIHSGDTRA